MRTRSIVTCGLAASLLLLTGCASTRYGYSTSCTGECINGSGSLKYLRNSRVDSGQFADGLPVGMFQIQEPGRTIAVAALNGMPHGQARIRNATGQEYEQTYAFGFPVQGKTIYSNGDTYDGSYRTMLTAKGPLTLPKEGVYTTAQGTRLKGRFELVADQLLFKGSLQTTEKRPVSLQAASPLPTGVAPYVFSPVGPVQLATLQDQAVKWNPAAVADRSGDVFSDRYFFNVQEYHAYIRQSYSGQPNTGLGALVGVAALGQTANPGTQSYQAANAGAQGVTPAYQPAAVAAAQPAAFQLIEGNTGLFMSPFTSDGVAAGWVDKAINAQLGGSLGAAAGAYAGQKALEQVPFIGGFLGSKVGKEAGRSIALKMVGGEQYLRESSDISFNDINEMARWLMATHSSHPKFKEIMKASYQIYPDLQQAMVRAQYARR